MDLVGGIPTPLRKYEFVTWDYEIPNGKIEVMFQTTNQKRLARFVATGFQLTFAFAKMWTYLPTECHD